MRGVYNTEENSPVVIPYPPQTVPGMKEIDVLE
jgi:hypothetical protein